MIGTNMIIILKGLAKCKFKSLKILYIVIDKVIKIELNLVDSNL